MIKLKDKKIGLPKILCFNLEKHIGLQINRIKKKTCDKEIRFCSLIAHVVINSILAKFFSTFNIFDIYI